MFMCYQHLPIYKLSKTLKSMTTQLRKKCVECDTKGELEQRMGRDSVGIYRH